MTICELITSSVLELMNALKLADHYPESLIALIAHIYFSLLNVHTVLYADDQIVVAED